MPGFTLSKDNNSDALQALDPSTSVNASVSNAGQVRVTLPAGTSVVRVATLTNCYIKFGNSSVVATTSDMLFPIGAEIFTVKEGQVTHCSILGASATPDVCSITKMI